MQSKQNLNGSNLGNLTFGFDIGIASVGWAVLNETRIVDLGVRAFDAAEDPEDGTPHNQKRRGGRVARNRLHTRAWRLKRLRRLMRDAGLISSSDFQNINQKPRKKGGEDTSPWTLRSKALTEKLSPDDWARVIYHIVKHRGFGVLSQTEFEIDSVSPADNSLAKEKDALKKGLLRNSALLRKHKESLKTLGNIAIRLPQLEADSEDGQSFRLSIRNKGKSYRHAFLRADLRDELETLFTIQAEKQNPFINIAIPADKAPFKLAHVGGEKKEVPLIFKDQVFALFDMQKPPISTEQMKGLIGDCELESEERNGKGKAEKRAPKNSFSNERATWLQKLNGIKIRRDGKEAFLSAEERLVLVNLPYEKEKITYGDIRDALCQTIGFSRDWREASFNMLSYRSKIKADAGWISVIDGESITSLSKYKNISDEKQLKAAKKKLKDTLLNSTITYAELRTLLNVPEHCKFQHAHRELELIQKELEATHAIPFSADDSEYILRDGITYKINLQKNNKSSTLTKKSYALLAQLKKSKSDATLADLRVIVEQAESINEPWLFEFNQTARVEISPSIEAETRVTIEYENIQSIEDSTCIELKGWHKLRKALAEKCPDFWQTLVVAYRQPTSKEGQETTSKLDEVARILAIYQTDFERKRELNLIGIKESVISELLKINFTGFRNLSVKALRNILPFLEEGNVFSKACEQAGYNHSQRPAQQRKTTLDPFETYQFERWRSRNDGGKALMTKEETRYKDLNNPTVARALNQARRVLNDLVNKHGSPAYIGVELARDLSRSKRLRDKIKDEQEAKRKERDTASAIIQATFKDKYGINNPSDSQITKVRLYEEQNQKCAYSYPEKNLDIRLILSDEDYVQIDHIWPKSSTFDNSLNNRVLVLAGANQHKSDDIPWDFFGKKDSAHWRHFQAWVNSCKGMPKEKQDHLLAKELDNDEFAARNLVDTRYVTKLFASILRERLLFAGGAAEDFSEIDNDEAGKDKLDKFNRSRVRTPQGGAIAFLRRCWGLHKNREESDLHHALDACVIAATSPSLIKQVNDFFRREEQFPYRYKKDKDDDRYFIDTKTAEKLTKDEALEAGVFFPKPWLHFREEVLARLSSDGRTYQTKKGERRIYDFANYASDEIKQVKSVLVSRLVKKKRNVELHDANPMGLRYYPVKLVDLTLEILNSTLDMLNNLDKETSKRRQPTKRFILIQAIQNQLAANNGDASLAFANGFVTTNKKGNEQTIQTIQLPMVSLPKDYLGQQNKKLRSINKNENFDDTAIKNVSLNKLSLKMLSEKELGANFYNRNKRLIEVLKAQLGKFNDDAEKSFSEPFYPFGKDDNRPFIRSIRIPAPRGSGIFVRGGVANLGDALYTEVYKYDYKLWFRARYKVTKEKTFGLPVMPNGAKFICNFSKNDFVRIKHPNLAYCYREISRHKDSQGNTLISVESIFDDGVFEGYWNYFEPSNDRPVLQLHDGREFFLLEDGKMLDKKTLTLIAKPTEKKKPKVPEEFEYFEFSEMSQDKPLKFSLVSDIKRKVSDTTFIEKAKVDVLGCIEKKQNGLA